MNQNQIFVAFCVFFIAVFCAQPIGENFIIDIQEIPQDGVEPGFVVQAQCWNEGNGQFRIVIDPDEIEDPQINRIVAHEIGHAVNWDGDEAYADDFANRIVDDGSEPIRDAYSGIH